MGLNFTRGRISNAIKKQAQRMVEKYGYMAFNYACVDCAFDRKYPSYKEDAQLIDCIVKILKERRLWD